MQTSESMFWKEIQKEPLSIEESLKANLPTIKKIANEVKERKIDRVVLAGRGSSDHANQVAKYLFEIYCGMIVSIATPSVLTCYKGKVDYSNTLLIGVSQSGCAKDLAFVMNNAYERGAIVVSITNEKGSLMSGIGNYRMNNACGPEKSVTAAKSYLTQTALLTALVAEISNNKKLHSVISNLSETVRYALTLEGQVRNIIPLLRNTSHMLIMGRGLLYALAQETELKIQETCYLDARSYATSDYQHGPMATTNTFVPIIMFAADAKTNDGVVQLLKKLKTQHHVDSIVISNQKSIANEGSASIIFAKKYDGTEAVFVGAVISQMMACLLSIARGYNPDEPVGISKHTCTF